MPKKRYSPPLDDASFLAAIARLMEEHGLLRISVSRLAPSLGQDTVAVRAQVRRVCNESCDYPAFVRRPGGLTVYKAGYLNVGLHLGVAVKQARHLRQLPSFSRQVDYLLDNVYPAVRLSNPKMACAITYAWQSIGRIIGTFADPLQDLMTGEGFLGASRSDNLKTGVKERALFFKAPALVNRLAKLLQKFSEERVRQAVDEYLGPSVGGPWRTECLFDVQGALREVRALFEKAAAQKQPVIFFGGCVT
jgi:hypothetical protein